MKLTPFANFIKLFCHNLCHYQCIAICLDSGCTTMGIHHAKKCFMKLTPVANVMKHFTAVSYDFS